MLLALCEVGLGVAMAIGAQRFLSSVIQGIPSISVRELGAAIVALLLAIVLAALSPTTRAVRADPMEVLRGE